jgi:hypothetical protein
MGRFDVLTQLETTAEPQPGPAPSRQEQRQTAETSLLANQQTNKPVNQQASLSANQQTGKPANAQTSKLALSTKQKRKYGTYLRDDSILAIQVNAAQARKKDHELLQEIVDAYFAGHHK